ncbi:hypothetical protein AB0H71_28985 [Nocardia sp. NPDC050697]|uniref:hypothetical protein n=1 Tax=Nocardia sp. NPDC050697 TaxID=3155158 RepID=UPI0033C72E29
MAYEAVNEIEAAKILENEAKVLAKYISYDELDRMAERAAQICSESPTDENYMKFKVVHRAAQLSREAK